METLVPHLVATLLYLSQNYSYYIRGDRSPLNSWVLQGGLAPRALSCSIWIFSHLKLRLATAVHNFKWLKFTWVCEIEVPTHITDTDLQNRVWRLKTESRLTFEKQNRVWRLKRRQPSVMSIVDISALEVDPFSVGTVFIRQTLTFVDVRFWRIKTVP